MLLLYTNRKKEEERMIRITHIHSNKFTTEYNVDTITTLNRLQEFERKE